MSEQIIGAAAPRVDGPDKLTGRAAYAADHFPEGVAHAYGVYSHIASGTIVDLDLAEARRSPGVIEIFHHDNFPKLYRSPATFAQEDMVDETRVPFEDNRVYYAGQFVALVVAETFEQARAAAYKVRVDYDAETTAANLDQAIETNGTVPADSHTRGDADAAFEAAPHKIDATYTTPVETHNPMEMHATTARWADDGRLVVYESAQGVVFARNALAKIFDLEPGKVEVHAEFIGSGFGGKLWIWPHSVATCGAARELGRPVQMMVPRQQMFTTTGHRAQTRQHLRLATDDNGKLVSLAHDTVSATSMINIFPETCGSASISLYGCDNVRMTHATAAANQGTPTHMRAPGAGVGLFALESAMDEMAEVIGMDPVEFRRLNYTDYDSAAGLPFSSIHLLEAFDTAAEAFGWSRRNPEIGAMREGDQIIGWGMASCNWPAMRMPASARVALRADGTAQVHCASQDIGTGTYTIVAQTAAGELGLPLDKIEARLGDSSFPRGPISGGSWATASALPAVAAAAREAIETLKTYAVNPSGPFAGGNIDDLVYTAGTLKDGNGKSATVAEVLNPQSLASAAGDAQTGGAPEGEYSFQSFGAHFVEITWDPGIAELKVTRVASAIDVGQVINAATARNQVEGAVMLSLGSALFEATNYDERDAIPVNNNYAEYLVPVHTDTPKIDVTLLDYPDYALNELGARGIGEIGVTGFQAAVANAVYHATGKRVRDLPITLDKLMDEA
ncbi:xanthine dehydrogenase family protein molybdopterin-binding subunit [Salinisphaera sp.]|uniref:xanthine dehydrogenase family protein molybdopterin-binding subunit n=1 Tax=Salinisphaera sp. TaxID=1914330 RepID=UPI002D789070|nr:xanthine dehydrogenase family protein molybdopterin-binding subunit [Salinisphaera sp.]HET7314835.1 xanthine dehydrogenase family protein molybdopterin-binding subunit [Salinisphaera sp.]